MFTLDYYAHSLAHAEGLVAYDVHTVTAPTSNLLKAEVCNIMDKYNEWMNDGFVSYVRFRLTTPDGTAVRYNYRYDDASRTFHPDYYFDN